MKPYALLLAAPMLLATAALAADAPPTVATLYDGQIGNAEHEIVPLVEAMPADKFGFAPAGEGFTGVRTFAEQAKHMAAVIYIVSAAARNEKVPVDTNGESGPVSFTSKQQIVKFLKDAFAYAHSAALSLTPANETQLVKSPFGSGQVERGHALFEAVWHSFDHYGQMVVYARMNGVVPPASR